VPTVFRIDGLRVVIYFNEHRPAHVHVTGGGNTAVLDLNCPNGPPRVRERYGFTSGELRRIETAIAQQVAALCRRWEEMHGNP
jgi:hypothetical protein